MIAMSEIRAMPFPAGTTEDDTLSEVLQTEPEANDNDRVDTALTTARPLLLSYWPAATIVVGLLLSAIWSCGLLWLAYLAAVWVAN